MTTRKPRKFGTVEEVGKPEDPPASATRVGQRFGVWHRRLLPLLEESGRWHLLVLVDVKNTAQSAAGRIQSGKAADLPGDGTFETAYGPHPTMPDKYGVWARYIPPEVSPDDND